MKSAIRTHTSKHTHRASHVSVRIFEGLTCCEDIRVIYNPFRHLVLSPPCAALAPWPHLLSLSVFVCLAHSFSALHHAALTGTTELLSLLLEAQATVDIKDINGITAAEYLNHTSPQYIFILKKNPKTFTLKKSVRVKLSLKLPKSFLILC